MYFIAVFAAIGFLIWLCGHMPFSDRGKVRHALGINILPLSVRIHETYVDSWTDYIFTAEISFNSNDIEKLTSGREFSKYTPSQENFIAIPNKKDTVTYSWSTSEGGFARCKFVIDQSKTRGSLEFAAD
jgi:hypothetical protein